MVIAFLNSKIPDEYEIYCMQPQGSSDGTKRVWKLNQALYGPRKAPLWWFETLVKVMKDAGFVPMSTEMCLFKHEKLGVLVLIYVDDILEMRLISKFLGLRIRRNLDTNRVFIDQEEYVKKIVSKYGEETTKYTGTPWKTDTVIPPSWESVSDVLKKRYLKQTGSLNYASTNTRPDIVKTVSTLCEANSNP
ncbi:Uu.00g036560.m01.CDS01 [Anthostomella pinea]|uniref:Uu.00g036560.m01.CDS01 n=2 Tax=Anthostomella pinea TaxID=933095 RepID=A0AAI8V9J9_9PEZI|nr:Uu.00g036560.m01.CDS01 [Anthostomella pinea]